MLRIAIQTLCSLIFLTSPLSAGEMPPRIMLRHLLDRVAYGPAPGDLEKVAAMGVEAYLRSQLHPESIPEPQTLTQRLAGLETLHLDPVALFEKYGPPQPGRGQKPDPGARQAARQRARVILEQAAQARLMRAIESPRQLYEVMVEFWFNHFNVFAFKGLGHLWVGAYEEQAIRPHALGRFRDLLGATAKHPAMLFYLDNWLNTAPGSPGARGRFQGLNENYARELLELHTLGVDGGYTQDDVIALARILTGWGLGSRRAALGRFHFDARRHDSSEKVFLGQHIPAGGIEQGEQALDILARHPSTARHIGYKLAQYFVADEPPASLVARLARRFLDTDGDIRAVLESLFFSPEFRDERYYRTKFKTPYRYLISMIRASGVEVRNYRQLEGLLFQQGMPLYGCVTPDGYKYTTEAWLNPDTMIRRVSFAVQFASGRPPFTRPLDASRLEETLGGVFSAQTRAVLASAPLPQRAALLLGSAEFMRH